MSMMAGSSPLQWQKQYPTAAATDKFLDDQVRAGLATADANDTLYRYDSSRDYDPSPRLESIKAPLLAINSADDFVNPPEMGIMEREITRVKRGRFILVPVTDQTRGHGTHSIPRSGNVTLPSGRIQKVERNPGCEVGGCAVWIAMSIARTAQVRAVPSITTTSAASSPAQRVRRPGSG
jgi:hypothetical protein